MATHKHHSRNAVRLSAWRKMAGDIALLTVLLQLLAPVFLSSTSTARSGDGLEPLTPICTANGIVYLQAGEDGGPVPVYADCPYCQIQGLTGDDLCGEPLNFAMPPALAVSHPPVILTHAKPNPWASGAPTRGPPL